MKTFIPLIQQLFKPRLALFALLLAAAGRAHAQSVVSDTNSTAAVGSSINGGSFAAGQFTLTNTATMNDAITITRIVSGAVVLSDLSVQIVGDNGANFPSFRNSEQSSEFFSDECDGVCIGKYPQSYQ